MAPCVSFKRPPESDYEGKNPDGIFPDEADMVRGVAKFKTAEGRAMPTARKIIIDTDPGQDDAVAILLALGSPELDILGITAVAGNVPLALTEKNARKICELAGRTDIKVFAGAVRPLLRDPGHGRARARQDRSQRPRAAGADDAAAEAARRRLHHRDADGGTGRHGHALPARAAHQHRAGADPRSRASRPRIKEIVMMGGGFFEGGNITAAAEFNIYVDPHAADVVFRSGVPIVMMPLDVTHKALTTADADRRHPRARHARRRTRLAEMLEFFERFDDEKYGTDGGPLHDPCVIAYLLQPELFEGRHCNVAIETMSELTMGMTVVDWWGVTGRPKNAMVMREIDHHGFFELLVERLGRL